MGEMRRFDAARRRRQAQAARFIGRGAELGRLEAALGEAHEGRGGAVLLAGDPGIGKTHTAEETARRADAQGFRVYWGRCHSDEGAPSLWPWLQVLRAHAERSDPAALRAELGGYGPVLVSMVPALREHVPVLPAAPTLPVEESRFRLFEAISGLIRRSAETAPWLVLLDDLHWADLPTLQLLRFAARELRDAPVLLIGTLRDAEFDPQGSALRLLREIGAQRIDLAGLAEQEVAELLASQIGAAPSSAWAEGVRAATGGNPFFVERVARLLPADAGAADTGSLRIPEEVRDVILGQIARLDAAAARVVSVASVIGRDFELALLARACELDASEALRALGPALEARLVRPGDDAGRYQFVHPLIQGVVYGALSPAKRDACHLRVGEQLEAAGAGDADGIAQLARHFIAAAHLGAADRAVHHADRAAAAATTLSAYEEAVRHLEAALALVGGEPSQLARRVDLQLRLGEARRGASSHIQARSAFAEAAAGARQLGDPERLARAALGFAGFWASLGFVDAQITGLLEEASAALGDRHPALRSRLASRLALEYSLGYSADREARDARSSTALALARTSGDDAALAHALYARQLVLGLDHLPSLWSEAARLAVRADETDLALASLAWQAGEALQRGDLAGFDEAVAVHGRLAGSALHRTSALDQIVWRGLRAAFDGRFADAESLFGEIPRRFEAPQHTSYAAPALLAIRWHQGRLAEMADPVRRLADVLPGMSSGHIWLAWIQTELGDRDAAEARLARIAANDFALLERTPFIHLEAMLAGQVAAFVGDRHTGQCLSERLLPFARHRAVNGTALCDFGPVARTLGLLAAARGDLDEAVVRLDEAVAADARIAAKPHKVHAEVDLARVLFERGGGGDARRAAEIAARARSAAETFGMRGALDKLDTLRPARGAATPGLVAIEAVLTRDASGLWSLRSQGRVHHMEDVKGLAYLGELLRQKGHAVAAVDLAGEVPALRSDLEALREALAEAEELGDAERVETLRDALESRVAGRDDGAERARVNVTRALKLAVRRIAEADPRLGRDLEANLRTGAFCTYEPDPLQPVRWIASW